MDEIEDDGPTPHFNFSAKDVFKALKENRKSQLESILCERWDIAKSRGAFRYDLSGVTTRTVPGDHKFVLQCNPKRHTQRRTPANISSLVQPFDLSLFNFNKIKDKEVLFQLNYSPSEEDGGNSADGGGGGKGASSRSPPRRVEAQMHLVVVNVSPITYGHALVIPQPKACLPQVWTRSTIHLCLDLVALSNSSTGFCVVANSLLAHASVNHLHYHILYVKDPVLSSSVKGVHLKNGVYSLSSHPSPGFGFQVTSSTAECARKIYGVVELLLSSGIAHNMVILWGEPFNQQDGSPGGEQSPIVRAILVPRKPVYGEKVLPGSSSDSPPFSAAACELVQGFIPVSNETSYHNLEESDILKILQEKMLLQEEFQTLVEQVKQLQQN